METIQMRSTNVEFARVRKFSRYARHICTALLALFAVALGFMFLKVVPDMESVTRKYLMTMLAFSVLLTACFTWLLRRLFDNLARGEIFSSRNIGCIRHIAYLFVGIGVWRLLAPLIYKVLVANELLEPITKVTGGFISNAFMAFAVAGILLLASWIMGIGLGVTREADELRRDAELVV